MYLSREKLLAVTLLSTLLLMIACRGNNPPAMALSDGSAPAGIEVRRNVQFADIPAPRGFKFNRKYSSNFQGSALRGGTVVYDGTWNVAETSNWYLREMPKTGWQHRATTFATDYDVVHDFVKGDEMIKMRIWRPGSDLRVEMNIDKLAAYAPQKTAAQ